MTSIEDFSVGKYLDKGGFASVYLAVNNTENRLVALKKIAIEEIHSFGMIEKVKQEAKIHYQLKHPNVVTLYNIFETGTHIYLELEFCKYGSLRKYLERHGKPPISEPEACSVIHQVLEGILYLRKHNIIHRDITLSNLLIDEQKTIKIADFGLATMNTPGKAHMTMCGTPNYIAPEVATKACQGPGVDVWCLGIILFTLLYGKSPFETTAVSATLDKVVTEPIAFIHKNIKISYEAEQLIRKLLEKDQTKRIDARDISQQPFMRMYPKIPLQCDELQDSGVQFPCSQCSRSEQIDSKSNISYHKSTSGWPPGSHLSSGNLIRSKLENGDSRCGQSRSILTKSGHSLSRTEKERSGYPMCARNDNIDNRNGISQNRLHAVRSPGPHRSRAEQKRSGCDAGYSINDNVDNRNGSSQFRSDFVQSPGPFTSKTEEERSGSRHGTLVQSVPRQVERKSFNTVSNANYETNSRNQRFQSDPPVCNKITSISNGYPNANGHVQLSNGDYSSCNGRNVSSHRPKPEKISTARLRPTCVKDDYKTCSLLPSGDAVVEFTSRSDKLRCRVSGDGNELHVENIRNDILTKRCHTYEELPNKLWHYYGVIGDFIKFVKGYTLKISLGTTLAACTLMEDSPNTFSASFFAGYLFKKIGDRVFVTCYSSDERGVSYAFHELISKCKNAPSAFAEHFMDCYNQCLELENCIETKMSMISTPLLPATFGAFYSATQPSGNKSECIGGIQAESSSYHKSLDFSGRKSQDLSGQKSQNLSGRKSKSLQQLKKTFADGTTITVTTENGDIKAEYPNKPDECYSIGDRSIPKDIAAKLKEMAGHCN